MAIISTNVKGTDNIGDDSQKPASGFSFPYIFYLRITQEFYLI